MKQRSLFFTVLAIPVDILMWVGAYIVAYFLRAHFDTLPVTYVWPFTDYLRFILELVPLVLATMTLEGLYNHRYPKKGLSQFSSLFISATAGVMYVVLWVFFTRSFFFSRLLILYAWLISVAFLLVGRWLLSLLQLMLNQFKIGLRNIVIIGPIDQAMAMALPLKKSPRYGFNLVGIVAEKKFSSPKNIRYLGKRDQLPEILQKNHVSDMIVAEHSLTQNQIIALSEVARDNKTTFHLTPGTLQLGTNRFATSTIAGLPVIEILETSLEGVASIAKRFFDIVGSILFIALFSWLYIIVAVIVKLTSPGPIFYKDRRVGEGGEFDLYKFRTFKKEYCTGEGYGGQEAEKLEEQLIKEKNTRSGPIPKIKDDPRVTPVGNFLRRTSLDELPQFFNVIAGTMSIVGPRPHRPKEVAGYKPRHRKLFLIKPGITGMAQVSGRSDLDFEDEADLDIYYIEKWSIWLDIQIIWQTIFVVFRSDGAY